MKSECLISACYHLTGAIGGGIIGEPEAVKSPETSAKASALTGSHIQSVPIPASAQAAEVVSIPCGCHFNMGF